MVSLSGLALATVSRVYSLAVMHRLLVAVASLAAEHWFQGVWTSVAVGLWLELQGSGVAAHGLQSVGSLVVMHGLSCSMASSQNRDETCALSIGRWIFNHWATREVHLVIIKKKKKTYTLIMN